MTKQDTMTIQDSMTNQDTRWDIVHLDLAEGIMPFAEADRGVFVVFWWRDIPLGQLELEPSQRSMTASELAWVALRTITPAVDAYLAGTGFVAPRRRQRPTGRDGDPRRLLRVALSLLDSRQGSGPCSAAQAEQPPASISVVVPTCDRPQRLAACLRSLAGLREKPLEIVVVDNAPSIATREVVEAFPEARYVAEHRSGSSAARNTGVHHCRGELVAFVDDDEAVHPDWLSHLRNCFHNPTVGLATGLVLPSELETEAQRIFEQRYSFARGYVARTFDAALYRRTRNRGVPVWEIGGSGNMAIRRHVFEQLGGFDERLGAGRAGGCEEFELFYRALAGGWSCRYEPRAVTEHQHRREMKDLERQLYAYMRGHVASALVQLSRFRDLGNLRHLMWTLPKVYAGYTVRSVLRDPAYRARLLAVEIAGCVAGLGYYRRHRGLAAWSSRHHLDDAVRVSLDGANTGTVVVTSG